MAPIAASRRVRIAALATIAAVLGGVAAFLFHAFLLPELRVLWRFEPTQATITASRVQPWPGRGSGAAPDIRFKYRAGATEHAGGRWRVREYNEGSAADIAALVAQYPAGSVHRAWYDPDEPSVAVLSRRPSFAGLLGLVFAALAVGVPWWLWRLTLPPARPNR
jgi:hypothetical protein